MAPNETNKTPKTYPDVNNPPDVNMPEDADKTASGDPGAADLSEKSEPVDTGSEPENEQ